MLKRTLISLTLLSMAFLLVSCASLKKSQNAEVPAADKEMAAGEATEGTKNWDNVWEKVLTKGEDVKSSSGTQANANDVLFDYDRYNIRQDARPTLNSAASYLIRKKQVKIVIEGHGDERGTNEYNLALGEKRAKATHDYLNALGVDSSRMHTVTYGEERPLCTDSVESCWQMNRRSSIKMSDLD